MGVSNQELRHVDESSPVPEGAAVAATHGALRNRGAVRAGASRRALPWHLRLPGLRRDAGGGRVPAWRASVPAARRLPTPVSVTDVTVLKATRLPPTLTSAGSAAAAGPAVARRTRCLSLWQCRPTTMAAPPGVSVGPAIHRGGEDGLHRPKRWGCRRPLSPTARAASP